MKRRVYNVRVLQTRMTTGGFITTGHCKFAEHRSGWNYVMRIISEAAGADEGAGEGTRLIDFAEKMWGWDLPDTTDGVKDIFFAGRSYTVDMDNVRHDRGENVSVLPSGVFVRYREGEWSPDYEMSPSRFEALPRLGRVNEKFVTVFHNPPNAPEWFDYKNSPQVITKRKEFTESIANCQGIYVLSKYLKDWLLSNVGLPCPVEVLDHPTEPVPPERRWTSFKMLSQSRVPIVQIGYWLRRLSTIYRIPLPDGRFEKIWLYGNPRAVECLEKEAAADAAVSAAVMSERVALMRLGDDQYDELLSRSVALIDLYDSSCNNAIIECVMRETPALVRRLPATVEYLGPHYPLFFDTLEEAAAKATDVASLVGASRHMRAIRETGRYSREAFEKSLLGSFIYRKITGGVPPLDPLHIVSLGVDCFPRAMLTKMGFKKRKEQGELTSPFDLAFHHQCVVIDMIYRDFFGFWEPHDLGVDRNGHIVHVNGSVYNHESDTPEKREFYSRDDYAELRKRYEARAANFRWLVNDAISKGRQVLFVNMGVRYPVELQKAIRCRYPSLDFTILTVCLMYHGSSYADTLPNVEHGTDESRELGFMFYNVMRPYKDYVWYDAADFSSGQGQAFERRVYDILCGILRPPTDIAPHCRDDDGIRDADTPLPFLGA